MSYSGKLILIPSPIAEDSLDTISPRAIKAISETNIFICERTRTVRRFIKKCVPQKDINNTVFIEMNKHDDDISEDFLSYLADGQNVGLLSEAGLPCLADPGERYVHLARKHNYTISVLAGPCAVTQALLSSGFNAEQFTFHGYLPHDAAALKQSLTDIQRPVANRDYTQVWIETPYRNGKMIETVRSVLQQNILLCVIVDIDSDTEEHIIGSKKFWSTYDTKQLHKRPAIFLLGKA